MARALIKEIANRKNYLLNGNFDFWQRGTSFSTAGTYQSDRWYNPTGELSNVTVTKSTATPFLGSTSFSRATSTGASSFANLAQALESTVVNGMKGKTFTFSIVVRRNSTFNATGISVAIQKNATADTRQGGTWSTISGVSTPLASLAADTWVQLQVTATIPNDGTANGVRVYLSYNTSVASGSILDISQGMLNEGSVAAPFTLASPTIDSELQSCKRYYQQNPRMWVQVRQSTTTEYYVLYNFEVEMRIAPTPILNTTTPYSEYPVTGTGRSGSGSTISVIHHQTLKDIAFYLTGFSGLTALGMAILELGVFGVDAEL